MLLKSIICSLVGPPIKRRATMFSLCECVWINENACTTEQWLICNVLSCYLYSLPPPRPLSVCLSLLSLSSPFPLLSFSLSLSSSLSPPSQPPPPLSLSLLPCLPLSLAFPLCSHLINHRADFLLLYTVTDLWHLHFPLPTGRDPPPRPPPPPPPPPTHTHSPACSQHSNACFSCIYLHSSFL